jgi:hypothetical protein
MTDAGVLLLFVLAILAAMSDRLLRKFETPSGKFPWCRTCGKNMVRDEQTRPVPDEVRKYMVKNELPLIVLSKFICPKGHYRLWYVPKVSSTENPFFYKEEL